MLSRDLLGWTYIFTVSSESSLFFYIKMSNYKLTKVVSQNVIIFGECLNLLRATPLKNGCTSLTLSHIKTLSDASAADDFWKHYEKRRNYLCTVLIWGGGTVWFYDKYEVLPSSLTLMWYQNTIQYRSNKTLFDMIWLNNNELHLKKRWMPFILKYR